MRLPIVLTLFVVPVVPAFAADPPAWVRTGGADPRYPARTHLTGFGAGATVDAARAAALADLTSRVVLRVEHLANQVSEAAGQNAMEAAALARTLAAVRVPDVHYETHADGQRAFALAVAERAAWAPTLERDRDRAAEEAWELLASAQKAEQEGRAADALAGYLAARLAVARAREQHAVARAVSGQGTMAFDNDPGEAGRTAAERARALVGKPLATLKDAMESLAVQLREQGVGNQARLTVAPLSYGATPFSSAFGRRAAQDLERALATAPAARAPVTGDLALRGTYVRGGGAVEMTVIAREPQTGRAVASAQASVPERALPADLPLLPENYQEALREQRLLGAGEEVSGDLRVELWTSRGRNNLVFAKGEAFKLYVRVNRPAWVRLVYLLASGHKVPLTQAWYIDESKVNMAVEFPEEFEVSAPFGVEQIQAVAFTEKPQPLLLQKIVIDGEEYEVVAEGVEGLIKHRGVKKKKASAQVAETVVALTTVAR